MWKYTHTHTPLCLCVREKVKGKKETWCEANTFSWASKQLNKNLAEAHRESHTHTHTYMWLFYSSVLDNGPDGHQTVRRASKGRSVQPHWHEGPSFLTRWLGSQLKHRAKPSGWRDIIWGQIPNMTPQGAYFWFCESLGSELLFFKVTLTMRQCWH